MKPTINLQDVFLNKSRKENIDITIFLMNGYQLKGIVKGFDNYTIILDSDGQQKMIYKHAISTILADGTTVVKIYYDRNIYTLNYEITGAFFAEATHATADYEFGAPVTAVATPSQTGYTFVGWTGVPPTMPANDVNATGFYKANEDTAYKVEHYLKNVGLTTYKIGRAHV